MKKIVIAAFVALGAFVSNASYLYWTVNQDYTMQNTGATYTYGTEGKANTFEIGHIMAYKTSEGIDNSTQISADYGYTTAADGTQRTYTLDMSNYSDGSYSFYLELLAYDGDKDTYNQIGLTPSKTYANLVSDNVIYDSGSLTPIATAVWHGGGTMNAPEPTSAMLMLLGVAGLALRRKQRKIA